MKTPIADFIENYIGNDISRFHMPGHKGKGFLGVEKFDITEIDSADVLYNANGIILESQKMRQSFLILQKPSIQPKVRLYQLGQCCI